MRIELFRDDNPGYAAWLVENAQGYVLNIQRSLNPSDAHVHAADCQTINGTPTRWALANARSAITNAAPASRNP